MAVRRLGQHPPAVLGRRRRARHDLGAVDLHEVAPVRLLVVARPDHVDLDLEPEVRAGEGERRAPLAGARLGRQPLDAGVLVVERLGQRRVRLVAAGRAAALVLVVDVGRRAERLLEPMRPVERARPIQAIRLPDRLRDLDLALAADLLADERHREERRQVVRADRLARARVEHGRGRHGEVGDDVVPGLRDAALVEDELRPVGGHRERSLRARKWRGRAYQPTAADGSAVSARRAPRTTRRSASRPRAGPPCRPAGRRSPRSGGRAGSPGRRRSRRPARA